MGKYEPLQRYLETSKRDRIDLSFSEVEALLGFPLPRSSRSYRAWWSNNSTNNVMTNAWIAAGYRTEQVNIEQEKLTFKRIGRTQSAPSDRNESSGSHPIFGCAQGLLKVSEQTDLTAPADPSWSGPNELMSQ